LGAAIAAAQPVSRPAAAPFSFQAQAERAEVKLGEPFRYTIQIRHDPRERYRLSEPLELPPFQVADPRCERQPIAAGATEATTTCSLQLSLFELEEREIPTVSLTAETEQGEKVLEVPGTKVKGVGITDPAAPTETLSLQDIKPAVPLRVRTLRPLYWALGLLAAAGAVIALVLWLRKRARRGPEPIPAIPLAPHERARRRLAELRALDLPARGRQREHFFRLSEIVREYLSGRYGLNALDLTTGELLTALRQVHAPSLDREGFAAWCRQADSVKYAKREPPGTECAQALDWAQAMVERTHAAEPMPPESK
jgi:hypothetical protein